MKLNISIYILIYGLLTIFSTHSSEKEPSRYAIDALNAEKLKALSGMISKCKEELKKPGLSPLVRAAHQGTLQNLQGALEKAIKGK